MKSIPILSLTALFLSLIFISMYRPPGPFRPGFLKDKNIIVISIDALRADRLGVYGHHRQSSPFTDAFAKEAIVFEKALAPSSYTLASHVSLFTGLSLKTHKTGIVYARDGTDSWTKTALDGQYMTMAEYFVSTGRRALFAASPGNYHLNVKDSEGRGFEEELPNFMNIEYLFQWIDENPDQKFFAFLHTSQVHAPYYNRGYNYHMEHWPVFSDPGYKGAIPDSARSTLQQFNKNQGLNLTRSEIFADSRYRELRNFWWGQVNFSDPADIQRLKDQYDNCIFHVDLKIGRLVAYLKAKNLFEKTVIVLTSDHGEAFGEHGRFRHNSLHKEILHIPLIMHIPGAVQGSGRRIKGFVSLTDLFPTLLELDGAPVPDYMEGKSLLPVVKGIRRTTSKTFFASDQGQRAVIDGKWKLIVLENGEKELYNTFKDFEETEDLSNKHPKIVRKLDLKQAAFFNSD